MRRLLAAVTALGSLLAAQSAPALTVERLETGFDRGTYRVALVALLDAAPAVVGAVLKDYEAYPSLDPRIRTSERVGRVEGGETLLRTRVHACEAFLCRSVTRVERVAEAPGSLVATVVPEQSQVRRGVTRTTWQAADGRTRVTYEAEFEPDFWVPALIARRFASHGLRESTLELFENVEDRARGL